MEFLEFAWFFVENLNAQVDLANGSELALVNSGSDRDFRT